MWCSFASWKQIWTIHIGHPWTYKSGFTRDNGHIFDNNKKKWLQGFDEKKSPQEVNKWKSWAEKDTEYEKNANGLFSPSGYDWMLISVSYRYTYRDITDQKSWMFICKIMNRGDTWSSHQLSAKCCLHCLMKDTSKTKHMTGLIFDGRSHCLKVNQSEFNRYENLFNTAYVVCQNILPFTDYTYKWSSFGQWSFYARILALTLLKQYLKFYTIIQ